MGACEYKFINCWVFAENEKKTFFSFFYRMENNANPPKEEMVGGLTYGPAPFKMRVSLRF